jgi:hypothetical protein
MLIRRRLPLSLLTTFALASAWPGSANAAPVTTEAESLTLGGSVGQTFAGAPASAGRALMLWSNRHGDVAGDAPHRGPCPRAAV